VCFGDDPAIAREGRITISHVAGTIAFPRDSRWLRAMNPTPDGKIPGESRCPPSEIQKLYLF